MTVWSMLALAGAMVVLAAVPGPGVFVTVARALSGGFGSAAVVVAGIVAGDLLFLMLAIYGLAAVLQWFGDIFIVVKFLGSAYLLWLGISLIISDQEKSNASGDTRELSRRGNFTCGLLITLANPKVILFYLGFLPTFIDLGALNAVSVSIVAIIVSSVLAIVMLGYAFAASRASALISSSQARQTMNRVAGTIILVAGFSLLLKS